MKERNLPVQIESMIKSLLNKQENIYIRANYRSRLVDIKTSVDEALRKFDTEYDTTFTDSRGVNNVKRTIEKELDKILLDAINEEIITKIIDASMTNEDPDQRYPNFKRKHLRDNI